MLKTALALVAAVFVFASTPPAQAAPTAGLSSVKSTQSVVEPALLAPPLAWLSLLASPRLLGPSPLLASPGLLASSPLLSGLGTRSSALWLVVVTRSV